MTAPSSIVAALARMLELLRHDPNDRDQLKAGFRDLYAVLEPAGAAISIDVKGMIIDGTALPHGLPGGGEVRIRFHTHGIGSVRVPAGVRPADLLAVVRLLATEPVGDATVESFVKRLPVEAALAIQVAGPRQLPTSSDTRTLDNLSAPIGAAAPIPPPPPELLASLAEPEQGQQFFSGFAGVILAMIRAPQFVITRVHGKAAGGAVGLISASDFGMAVRTASAKLSELAVGIGPFVVGPVIEKKLGLRGTGRNWNTATKLGRMAAL